MTNGWVDIKNTDMMLIMGGNPAENHPCGFKWAMEAKRQRNAKMIVVDPRYTRTAAVSDMHLQIRAGSDIAFLGGVINYANSKTIVSPKNISSTSPMPLSSLRKVSSSPRMASIPDSTLAARATINLLGTMKVQEEEAPR